MAGPGDRRRRSRARGGRRRGLLRRRPHRVRPQRRQPGTRRQLEPGPRCRHDRPGHHPPCRRRARTVVRRDRAGRPRPPSRRGRRALPGPDHRDGRQPCVLPARRREALGPPVHRRPRSRVTWRRRPGLAAAGERHRVPDTVLPPGPAGRAPLRRPVGHGARPRPGGAAAARRRHARRRPGRRLPLPAPPRERDEHHERERGALRGGAGAVRRAGLTHRRPRAGPGRRGRHGRRSWCAPTCCTAPRPTSWPGAGQRPG